MKSLIKPAMLKKGDTIATVSLSWGGAGDDDLLWRYNTGKRRLEEQFGFNVVEMPSTLAGSGYVYNNPQARAADLMAAFKNPEIKGIFSNIGGEDSIRMLPYIDFEVIHNNPKVFIGYSDTTSAHLFCYKAGITSFYGPSVLAEFAENIEIFPYTAEYFVKAVCQNDPIEEIRQSPQWTNQRIEWLVENKDIPKQMKPNTPFELIQGEGIASGRLFGGCLEVLEMAKGTGLIPPAEELKGAILFLETSENQVPPNNLEYWLRNYGITGVLGACSGIVFSKPSGEKYYDEYKAVIRKVLGEFVPPEKPVLFNLPFGHNEPMVTIPYGVAAEINCEDTSFKITESGVI